MGLVRSLFGLFFMISCLAHAVGCGQQSVTSPQPGEISRYLQEKPDAPVSSNQELRGVNGPSAVGQ